jgi:hypothetical protein
MILHDHAGGIGDLGQAFTSGALTVVRVEKEEPGGIAALSGHTEVAGVQGLVVPE